VRGTKEGTFEGGGGGVIAKGNKGLTREVPRDRVFKSDRVVKGRKKSRDTWDLALLAGGKNKAETRRDIREY